MHMKNTIWLRLFFLLVLIQAITIGRSLIWPELIAANLPWPASPLNARFIAVLYWMGGISALLSMLAPRYAAVRISLIEIGVVTGVLLLLTLPHLGEFTAATFPYRWMILYTIDPLAVGLVLWLVRGRDPAPAGRNQYAWLFSVYAAVLTIAGITLLVAPAFAAQLWPWALPAILGQVYSIFFLTFALGGLLAAAEPRWEGVWVYIAANLVMLVLILAVSAYHIDRFKAGPAAWVWFGLCLAGALAFAIALIRRPQRALAQGALT
jgi:hypothetical protein